MKPMTASFYITHLLFGFLAMIPGVLLFGLCVLVIGLQEPALGNKVLALGNALFFPGHVLLYPFARYLTDGWFEQETTAVAFVLGLPIAFSTRSTTAKSGIVWIFSVPLGFFGLVRAARRL